MEGTAQDIYGGFYGRSNHSECRNWRCRSSLYTSKGRDRRELEGARGDVWLVVQEDNASWSITRKKTLDEQATTLEKEERVQAIIKMAKDEHEIEGEVEIDDNAVVSEGDDNGAYVAAWVWVSFCDTPLDKEPPE